MKLLSIYIDGYKNLSRVNVDLSRITALVSLNNFGKSNLLEALDYSIRFIRSQPDEKEKMMSNSSLFPLNKGADDKRFSMLVTLLHDGQTLEYGYSFAWRKEIDQKPLITSETFRIKKEGKKQKFEQFILRVDNNAYYKKSKTGRCTEPINIDDNDLLINKLRAFDQLFYIDAIKAINNINYYVESSFDVKDFYQNDSIIKDLEDIDIDIHNIPQIVKLLRDKYPDRFELLKNTFISLFPNIEDIIPNWMDLKVTIPDSNIVTGGTLVYSLLVKDKELNGLISFEMMSDGSKRIFLILTRLILASVLNVSLIAIEEPENSIHPSLLIDYLRIIDQLLDDCKIIITSHSPYIISSLEPNSIYVGIKDENGQATFDCFSNRGSDRLTKEAKMYDVSNGDYLFSLLSDKDLDWSIYLENKHE